MQPQMIQTLKGTVDDVLFYKEESGYSVFDLETEDTMLTVVGELGQLEAGEDVELTGNFVNHPRFGQQFRADSCVRVLPSTVVNIERYLASGIIPGIGKALAKRIVTEFGEFTFQVIEKEPEKLCRIKGISPQKCEEIAYRWLDNVLVAKDGEDVVGFAGYGKYRNDELTGTGEVYAIYVLQQYWGKGVGRMLMQAALDQIWQEQ